MEIDKGLIGGSTVLMLLVLLKERDMYGYEIIKELKERSNNTFEFKRGNSLSCSSPHGKLECCQII